MTDPIEEEAVARQAVVTHASFLEVVAREEPRIVDILVNMFRNNDLHNERAWALIGTISELRRIATNARSDANTANGFVRARRAHDSDRS